MSRRHALPDREPDEDNRAWCERAAASIPAEELMRMLIDEVYVRKGWDAAWSLVGQFTGHGSGVSGAIVRRFLSDEAREERRSAEEAHAMRMQRRRSS